MARFLKSPQQQLIQMGVPVNVEFYSNLLDKAQQNLEKGTALKAAALEKMSDLPFLSQEDMDATYGKAENRLKGVVEEPEFVSPTRVAQAVMAANAEVLPGIQAVKAKARAAEMYEKMRVQYGPNFWGGVDPASQSIVDPTTGKYVDPNSFKARGINAEELDKLFLQSQLSTLTKPGELTWSREGAPAGKLMTRQTVGLSDADREAMYRPGTATALAIAKEQLKSMPELLAISNGNEEEALNRIMTRNYQTSGAYKQSIESNFIKDETWLNPLERRQLSALNIPPAVETPGRSLYDVVPEDIADNTIKEMSNLLLGLTNPEEAAKNRSPFWSIPGWDTSANIVEGIMGIPNKVSQAVQGKKLYEVPDINKDNTSPEQIKQKSYEKAKEFVTEYPDLYKNVKNNTLKQYSLEEYKKNKTEIDSEIMTNFIQSVTPIEVSMRMMRNELRALSPTEVPKLYDDLLIKLNRGLPLRKVEGKTLGKEIDASVLYGDKGKFNTSLQEASIVINPVEGRIELTVPGEDTRYAISLDNIDNKGLIQHFSAVKTLNKEYLRILKSGATPPEELTTQLRSLTDDLYRHVYEVYSK